MTDLVWSDVRAKAIVAFRSELPHAQTEAVVIEVFEQLPGVVLRAIDEVGEAVAQGKVRSGWAVLRARVTGAAAAARDVTVDAGDDRAKAITAAETDIRNALLYLDREGDLVDELFRVGGRLLAYAGDDALRERMVATWAEHRPRDERAERESAEYHAHLRDGVRVQTDLREQAARPATAAT